VVSEGCRAGRGCGEGIEEEQIMSSTSTEHDYKAGYFGMQVEGSPTEWRNIRLRVE
jgi:hypothetical protein